MIAGAALATISYASRRTGRIIPAGSGREIRRNATVYQITLPIRETEARRRRSDESFELGPAEAEVRTGNNSQTISL